MVNTLDRIAVSTTVASSIRCTDAVEYSPPPLLPSPPLLPLLLSLSPAVLLAGSGLKRMTPGPEKHSTVHVPFSLRMDTTC